MSSGFGLPAVNFGFLAELGKSFGQGYDRGEAPALLASLLKQPQGADPATGGGIAQLAGAYGAPQAPGGGGGGGLSSMIAGNRVPSFAGGQASMRSPGSGGDTETKFINALRDGGLTNPNGLAAVAAYASHESGYKGSNVNGSWSDPSESGQAGTSGGILSWRGDRFNNMRRLTAGAADPVVAQAKFTLTENPNLTLALQNAQSPEEANRLMADAWKFAGYNRPGGELQARLNSTRAYTERLASGAPAMGAAPGGRRPVQYADNEAQTQALEQRMGMMPADMGTQTAQADMPAPGAQEAVYYIPGTEPGVPSRAPFGGNQRAPDLDRSAIGNMERARATQTAQAGGVGLPGVAGGQGPQISEEQLSRLLQNSVTAPIAQQIIASRLKTGSDFGFQAVGESLYRTNSRTGAIELVPGVSKPQTTKLGKDELLLDQSGNVLARGLPAETKGQFIQQNGRTLYGDPTTGQLRDATPADLPPNWRPVTAQERTALGLKDDTPVFMTPEGPKSVGGQTINVNGGEKAQDAAIGADYGKRFVEYMRDGASAAGSLGTISTMERAMNAPGFYSGTGGPARLAFNRGLESLGIKDKGNAAPAEVFDALSNKVILDGLGGSLGAGISNGDRDFIQRTAPDLAKSPEGNRQLLGMARALAERRQAIAKLARDYGKANNNRLDPGFDERLAEWAEANPLFGGASSRAPQGQGGVPAASMPQRGAPRGAAPMQSAPAINDLEAEARRRGLIR